MKRIILITVLTLATSSLAPAQTAGQQAGQGQTAGSISNQTTAAEQQSGNVEQELMGLEQEFNQAQVYNDVAAFDRLLANDYVGIYSIPPRMVTKADEMARGKNSSGGVIESITLDGTKVRVYGDMAVVNGRFNLKRKNKAGEDTSVEGVFTDVWMRRDGKWQVVSSHSTPGKFRGQPISIGGGQSTTSQRPPQQPTEKKP